MRLCVCALCVRVCVQEVRNAHDAANSTLWDKEVAVAKALETLERASETYNARAAALAAVPPKLHVGWKPACARKPRPRIVTLVPPRMSARSGVKECTS